MESRYNEVAGDRLNLFAKSRVRYIEKPRYNEFEGKRQNCSLYRGIVNDWFVKARLQKWLLSCNFKMQCSLTRSDERKILVQVLASFWDARIKVFPSLSVSLFNSLFIFCHGLTLIWNIEVDFTFGLPNYIRYNEEFVISSFCSIYFTEILAGLKNIVRYIENFVK